MHLFLPACTRSGAWWSTKPVRWSLVPRAPAAQAVDGMLELMRREHGFERRDALALASVVVDLRVTQLVDGVKGIHAMIPKSIFH